VVRETRGGLIPKLCGGFATDYDSKQATINDHGASHDNENIDNE